MVSPEKYGCCVCKRQLKGKRKRPVSVNIAKVLRTRGIETTNVSTICDTCRLSNKNTLSKNISRIPIQGSPNENSISLPIVTAGKCNKSCIICRKTGSLKCIPREARMDIFINFGILVPLGARCCPLHLTGNFIKPSTHVHTSMFRKKSTALNSDEIVSLFNDLRKVASTSQSRRMSFDNHLLSDEDYKTLLGVSIDQFIDLNQHVTSMRNTKERTIRNAIGIFLFKMKCGLSNALIATLFGFSSRRQVARIIQQTRTALVRDFVPLHLGFSHLSRDTIVNDHTTDIAKQFFSDPISDTVILVMDSTYVFIQKSSAYRFQRLSYSMHKNRPLVKPFVITSTDGYIVDVMGPYLSNCKNNDASIIKHIITSN